MILLVLLVVVVVVVPSSSSSSSIAYSFLSDAIGSHMVLQQAPRKAHLWGWWTEPGAGVSVKFMDQLFTTKASQTGLWNYFLPPTPAGGPYSIEVRSSTGQYAMLTDVLFGDVYVCSGQSNMQFTVHQVFNASIEIQKADQYPSIRLFTVGFGSQSDVPLPEFRTISQPWTVASAATVGVGDWTQFSAICWFFGRHLYDTLRIPIGLISSNWGGSPIQTWSSPDALQRCYNFNPLPVLFPNSALWNAMIVPLLPMSITGALWYQGESNLGLHVPYMCEFPAMINDWRLQWGGDTSPIFPFLFVQLAPFSLDTNYFAAIFRLAQAKATVLPNVGMVTAIDLPDPSSPFGDVHPRLKQPIGYRLHLVGRALVYQQSVPHKGPTAVSFTPLPSGALVAFNPTTIGNNLVFLSSAQCPSIVPIEQCGWFDIQINGKWFLNQNVTVTKTTVLVRAPRTTTGNITGVRYAWGNFPVASLFNDLGLPAFPFAFPDPLLH